MRDSKGISTTALFGLSPAGLLVVESDRDLDIGNEWEVVRCKQYGTTVVTILGLADLFDRLTNITGGDQP